MVSEQLSGKERLLNRVLVIWDGDRSEAAESLFSASTISFLLSFPSPFLSRNKNTWIIVSNVALSSGGPIFAA